MAKKKTEKGIKEVEIPIKWYVPDNITTRFASNMTIQILEYEFKVSFFESKPEIRTDPKAPLPSEMRADCVASVIINAAKMPGFVRALQEQLELYNARYQNDMTKPKTE